MGSATRAVADVAMAVDTRQSLAVRGGSGREDVVDEAAMAADAVVFDHGQAVGAYLDGLVEVLEREALGVAIAVDGFGPELGKQGLGHVAVVADGDGVVGRALPAVIDVTHDVAVDAGLRFVRQVARAFGVVEGLGAESREATDGEARGDPEGADAETLEHARWLLLWRAASALTCDEALRGVLGA